MARQRVPTAPAATLGGYEWSAGLEPMARALGALATGRAAVAIPMLSTGECARLSRVGESGAYRPAQPIVGSGGRQVWQSFEICTDVPGPLRELVEGIALMINESAGRMRPSPCAAVRFNDLTLQRYPVGSYGITPHRDHRDYRYLVGVLVLRGRARFLVCDDRAGRNAIEVPAPPGHLVLMRAPGYCGSDRRPFHAIVDVAAPRLSLGMRYREAD